MSAVLELRGVRKAYGAVTAVDGVDLDVAEHELIALVGPSGCGKSTLLRLSAGLAGINDGTVTIAGEVVDDGTRRVEPEERRTGLVFQEHALFPHLTVADNIGFGVRQVPRRERAARVDHWLALIDLRGHGDRYPHELSGGERQRVALARALAAEPRLVLLDEPFASLDPNLRDRLRGEIVDVLRATGTPTLFVTHDQTEALIAGDRIAVMRAGRLEQIGGPEDVYDRPANRFVAAFMGPASFLPIVGGTTELGPPDRPAPDGALLVVRPEQVAVAVAVDDATARAVVTATEFRGGTRTYDLRLASGAELRAAVAPSTRVTVGDVVGIRLRRGAHAVVPASEC
jgi:iron(III) transport system ATP-binding protein